MAKEEVEESEATDRPSGTVRVRLRRGLNYTYRGKKYSEGQDYYVDRETAEALKEETLTKRDKDGDPVVKPRFRVYDDEEDSAPRAKKAGGRASRGSLRRPI